MWKHSNVTALLMGIFKTITLVILHRMLLRCVTDKQRNMHLIFLPQNTDMIKHSHYLPKFGLLCFILVSKIEIAAIRVFFFQHVFEIQEQHLTDIQEIQRCQLQQCTNFKEKTRIITILDVLFIVDSVLKFVATPAYVLTIAAKSSHFFRSQGNFHDTLCGKLLD